MGISRQSIKNWLGERKGKGDVSSPAKRSVKRGNVVSVQDTENFMEGLIRRRIHTFYSEREIPTLGKLLGALKSEADFLWGERLSTKSFGK